MQSINPKNGKLIQRFKTISTEEAYKIVDANNKSFLRWKETNFAERKKLMLNAAKILVENKKEYAKLITNEMGKVYKESIAEIEKCSAVCEYYAKNAENQLKDEEIQTANKKSIVTYQPLGTIFAIMPWNFPFWQVFRFASPNLMVGNVCLLKHAKNVMGCALAIEEIFKQSGFPQNTFCNLMINSSQVEKIIANKNVKAITLTGSTKAGKSVAAKAGEYIKKSVLELGGSDAYVILKDADLEKTTESCVKSRLINAGQSCISAKRFIVVEEIYDEFLELFIKRMNSIKMGDPIATNTDIGPQATSHLRKELHKQVIKSVEQGAKCELGGFIPEGNGYFYPPTILSNVTKDMPAYAEEMFGPVAAVIKAKNTDNAINIANDSDFGLGAAIFTQNIELGTKIAKEKIDSGSCYVNDFVKSDPSLPFGGIKNSGYGRELSHFGIREFVNIKTVCVG